ncbi:MAG: hypothetical protein J6K69_07310 [Candidatus Methanomethylophilaceae archaeon]|nr:hypothetical protein [Candidatus Methanomethylophilaceae archaeon]
MSELMSPYGDIIATIEVSDGRVVISQDDTIALYPEQAMEYIDMLKQATIDAREDDLDG